ncbi:MAG TPA: SWIM zinc finger family protein [Haliangiales bacterium]|nr:SWIM zinc finger family protein [Haliangiales bacterium]
MAWGYFEWRPYISVAERRRMAARHVDKLRRKGRAVAPIVVEGRAIAKTFWGKAWCANLEAYSDYANRLPRGRTYVRNGSVIDLQIEPGAVRALVCGSEIYETDVDIAAVTARRWRAIAADCAGRIDSVVELLAGKLAQGVMDRLCSRERGLFPAPSDIDFTCSCPDSARMCKHVAAVLYGIGARLDERPELLFLLRKVDEKELIARAGEGLSRRPAPAGDVRVLGDDDTNLGAMFGIDIQPSPKRTKRARR